MWILLRSVLLFFLCFLPFSFHLLFLSICFLSKRITLITLILSYSIINHRHKFYYVYWHIYPYIYRSSHLEVSLGKCVLKIRCRFIGEHPWWSAISIKLISNFIEIALRHGCSPVNLLHMFRTPFLRNTYGWLLLYINK